MQRSASERLCALSAGPAFAAAARAAARFSASAVSGGTRPSGIDNQGRSQIHFLVVVLPLPDGIVVMDVVFRLRQISVETLSSALTRLRLR